MSLRIGDIFYTNPGLSTAYDIDQELVNKCLWNTRMNKRFLNSVASNFKINFWSINFLNPKFDFTNLTINWREKKEHAKNICKLRQRSIH